VDVKHIFYLSVKMLYISMKVT